MPSRRSFLVSSAVAGGTLLTGFQPFVGTAGVGEAPAVVPLDLLILGGTGFIGPHLVRHAVVDDSGNRADWVRQSTDLLKGAVGRYLFTSSTGVYYPYLQRGLFETDPVHYDQRDPKDGEEAFGVMKAQGARYVLEAFGEKGLVVRPTCIVGPGDTSDRFPCWPVRLARGGEVLAPSRADDPWQFFDVRDLAEFMVRLLEEKRSGLFNAAGPETPITARAFYAAAAATLNANVKFTYVEDYDFLRAHKIEEAIPWAMLSGNNDGMMSIRNARAIAAVLTFWPLADTVRDTLAWWPSVPEARRTKPRFSITPEIEGAALGAWHARGS